MRFRFTLVLIFSLVIAPVSGCTVPETGETGGPASDSAAGSDTLLRPPVYGSVYLVNVNPDPGVAVDESVGCGDRLSPITVRTHDSGLASAIEALLAQPDTMGLVNVLARGDGLRLDSVDTAGEIAAVYLSGELQIGGVCDHPRIVGQLLTTARTAAQSDTVAFFVDGQSLGSYLSLR